MELGRELFECEVLPLGDILSPLAEEEWIWIETKSERGAADMAVEEAQRAEISEGSDSVLPVPGDEPPVAMGATQALMGEIESTLRDCVLRIKDDVKATNTLYRCIDRLKRYNNGEY